MLICAGMLLVGAVTAFIAIPTKLRKESPAPAEDVRPMHSCAVAGTPLQPHHQEN
jgi:hypothetical protein